MKANILRKGSDVKDTMIGANERCETYDTPAEPDTSIVPSFAEIFPLEQKSCYELERCRSSIRQSRKDSPAAGVTYCVDL